MQLRLRRKVYKPQTSGCSACGEKAYKLQASEFNIAKHRLRLQAVLCNSGDLAVRTQLYPAMTQIIKVKKRQILYQNKVKKRNFTEKSKKNRKIHCFFAKNSCKTIEMLL